MILHIKANTETTHDKKKLEEPAVKGVKLSLKTIQWCKQYQTLPKAVQKEFHDRELAGF